MKRILQVVAILLAIGAIGQSVFAGIQHQTPQFDGSKESPNF